MTTPRRTWFDPFGRAPAYGSVNWNRGGLDVDSLRKALESMRDDLRGWRIGCWSLFAGTWIALVFSDTGGRYIGLLGWPLLLIAYRARSQFLRTAYFAVSGRYRDSLRELPEHEREAKEKALWDVEYRFISLLGGF